MNADSRRFRYNPSFSSTLLDEIYRSIDEQSSECRDSVRRNESKFSGSKSSNRDFDDDDDDNDERRACLIQKLMENKKPVTGRRSAADLDRNSVRCEREPFCFNSISSSCDSSCCGGGGGGGGRSGSLSSDNESVYGNLLKPKPIRTSVNQHDEINKRDKQRITYGNEESNGNPKHEGKFMKTKSKALKIYSDLKKVKQPISPGGRLSSFLNSIFTTRNTKKTNTSSGTGDGDYINRKSKSTNASTCSSASSISRSCLSNTPSSRGKSINSVKPSVRFYPVSVIVDEDETRLESVKFVKNSIDKDDKLNSSEKNRRISEAARNLLKNYQKKVECEFNSIRNNEDEDEEKQSDDDGRSDSSSDLFELDSLSAIGMNKYREELPVYETTHFDTNRAIANGLLT